METNLAYRYLDYLSDVRRYSPETLRIYDECLNRFFAYSSRDTFPEEDARHFLDMPIISDRMLLECLNSTDIRAFVAHMLSAGYKAKTVNLHISVLSGLCRFLCKNNILQSNPARLASRPKTDNRLPEFYRWHDMHEYFSKTEFFVSVHADSLPAETVKEYLDSMQEHDCKYEGENYILTEMLDTADSPDKFMEYIIRRKTGRIIVSVLFSTGIRRSELISLRLKDFDPNRKVLRVIGKGDKMREIPLIPELCKEIFLYLQSVHSMIADKMTPESPLLVTPKGEQLYPVFVDRIVKEELGEIQGITSRKSPHVLRHTVATELLDQGADLNSIKEMLGHASLAATQVYTHNSIEKLKNVYKTAHPRAKNGGKNGD